MKKFDPVNRYENEIESWKNIIVISIFAAIGVNLIVSGLVLRIKSTYASTLVIIGIAICVCMSGLYIYNRLRSQKRSNVVRGFFIYDREEKAIIKIPRYEIVERMWLYMISVKTHNPKLRELWESDEVALVVEQKDKTPRYQIVKTESDKLFVELLEYCVLDILSCHLIDFFNSYESKDLITLKREDMPDIIGGNRFLSWLSEDNEEERKEFDRILFDKELSPKERVDAIKRKKAPKPFARFEMVLPKNGTITRTEDGIKIDHPLLSLVSSCSFSGCTENLPVCFEKHYLGIDNAQWRYAALSYSVNYTVSFKLRSFFSRKRSAYSKWIDSFSDRINEFMSKEVFFERIGWETANTIIQCESNLSKVVK